MTPDKLCFGCGRVPSLKDSGQAAHFWRNCPNKHRPEVVQAFQEGRRAFLEKKRAEGGGTYRRQVPPGGDTQRDSQRQRTEVSGNTALANPSSAKSGGMNKLSAFFPIIPLDGDTTIPVSLGMLAPAPAVWDPIDQLTLPIANASLVESLQEKFKDSYDPSFGSVGVSTVLPFFDIPVGEEHSNKFLSGMGDTGAGCTIGQLDYHKKIAIRYPDAVIQLVDLNDIDGGRRATPLATQQTPLSTPLAAETTCQLTKPSSCWIRYGPDKLQTERWRGCQERDNPENMVSRSMIRGQRVVEWEKLVISASKLINTRQCVNASASPQKNSTRAKVWA